VRNLIRKIGGKTSLRKSRAIGDDDIKIELRGIACDHVDLIEGE
jgi:hypothetical protein